MYVGIEGGRGGALLGSEGDSAVRVAQAASAGADELKRDAKPWQNWVREELGRDAMAAVNCAGGHELHNDGKEGRKRDGGRQRGIR
jgi:hypothetical protein